MKNHQQLEIGGVLIEPGQTKDVPLKISETYSGAPVVVPVRVLRAAEPGPVVFVVAAVHGDELNGVGVVRELMLVDPPQLVKGSLLLVPVINIFGFENHSRYMPDRRDLNRCFPGSADGSLGSRLAEIVFTEIILKSDYGIDLHTAAHKRTNFPSVRGDLKDPNVLRLAQAFGWELMVNKKGPVKSLRREAVRAGCPTITVEAGETGKIEPAMLEIGLRGVRNVLKELGMIAGRAVPPAYQIRVERTKWVRASISGLLQFHVSPGDFVDKGQPLATVSSLLGDEQDLISSPLAGIVFGISTLPTIKPGEAVCHIARPAGKLSELRKNLDKLSAESIHQRVREDLATNIAVAEPDELLD